MSSKFDNQLSRMEYLMNYRLPVNEAKSSVEFSAEGADGKRYGIIKEGAYFYIKVCNDKEKQNLAESYEYINGITAKKEHQYKNYNQATKHLELKLMSLNEAYNGKTNTSTVDFKSNEKAFSYLTEEARKELNRMHAIFENSMTIGMNNTGNPEAPKTSSFSATIGKPFEETAKAELDKDFKKTAQSPEKQGKPFSEEEKVSNSDMESDKAPKGGESEKDFKDAEYVPKDAVASKKPNGGKVVRVNEAEDDILGLDDEVVEEPLDDEDVLAEPVEDDEYVSDDEIDSLLSDDGTFYGEEPFGDDEVEYYDDEMEEGNGYFHNPDVSDEEQLDDTPDEIQLESVNASLKRIVENVCDDLMAKEDERSRVNESFGKYIDKIIREEITNLNVFGKHPGYRKKPMTTPSNTEVIKNKGDKDWNDDSAKSEKPFGSKIGSSSPFDIKVKVLTDAVLKSVTEALKKK